MKLKILLLAFMYFSFLIHNINTVNYSTLIKNGEICKSDPNNSTDCYLKSRDNYSCCYFNFHDLIGCYWQEGKIYGNTTYMGLPLVCVGNYVNIGMSIISRFIFVLLII